jgi:hypothetical protein
MFTVSFVLGDAPSDVVNAGIIAMTPFNSFTISGTACNANPPLLSARETMPSIKMRFPEERPPDPL